MMRAIRWKQLGWLSVSGFVVVIGLLISADSRMVRQRLLEDGMAETRPGYSMEYCGMTSVDLYGVILQAALAAAENEGR